MEHSSGDNWELPQLLQQFYVVAQQMGQVDAVNALTSYSRDIHDKVRHLAIIGKMTPAFFNQLVHAELVKPSVLPLEIELDIAACDEHESPWCLTGEEKHPLTAGLVTDLQRSPGQPMKLFIDDPWLRGQNVVISVKPYPGSAAPTPESIFRLFSTTDLVLFLTDALSVLKRDEVCWLKECSDTSIPFIVGLSRLELVNEEERNSVPEYVKNYLADHFPAATFWDKDESGDPTGGLFELVGQRLQSTDLTTQRIGFFTARFIHYLSRMRHAIADRQQISQSKMEEIRQTEAKEKAIINTKNDQWTRIGIDLVQKRQNLEQQLRDQLSAHRQQMLENLLFELGRSNDAKLSWERDLPFFINRQLHDAADKIGGKLQREIMESLQWLYEEVVRVFNYKMPVDQNISIGKDIPQYVPKELPLMNTQKYRLRSKYGNAATIIGAGTIFLSAPVGGIVIASSIIYQALTENHIIKRTKKEKEQLKGELYKVVERMEGQFVNEFAARLKNCFDEIIGQLKTNQQKWLADVTNIIETKTAREMSQAGQVGLDQMLEKVNYLITQLI
jgi:hypothetical protein